jgi:pimeloyl-ACP methyl ester carboxylesterase
MEIARNFSLAEALYFDSGAHRLFGWLHPASGATQASRGLVICKPFGYESICAHRGLRAFAEDAAANGIPALRFDYLGTGDSGDIDPLANQLELWSKDVAAAAGELQRRTGVDSVCLLGLRMGALVAMLAAEKCPAVDSLVLVSPIISGRRFLKELRTTRMAAALATATADAPGAALGGPAADGSTEISGFTLSGATLAALNETDLTAPAVRSVHDVLVIDGSSMPFARRWADTLTGLGVRVDYQALPGLVEMTMTAPQFALIPERMIAATREWLLRLPAGTTPKRPRVRTHLDFDSASLANTLTLAVDSTSPQQFLTERPVFFGSDAMLFGIVTEPPQGEIRRRAVVLLNAAADHHIGASGIYVGLARAWARRGYLVLRMDLAGLGDSATRDGRPDNDVFPPAALDDVRSALDFLRNRFGIHEIALGGLCSGAYHAFRAAVARLPIERVLLINPQNYFWDEGMNLKDLQLAEVVRNPGVYRERMFSREAWKRMFSGQVNIWRIIKIYIQRPLLAVESMLRDVARQFRIHLPSDLGWELEEIASRGVRIVFIFSRGEPGFGLLRLQAGSTVQRLGDRCRLHIIEDADHVFTQIGPRKVMEKILSEELFARA